MIVPIKHDIGRYEVKAIGQYTLRQLLCSAVAVILIVSTYYILMTATDNVTLSALPAICLGAPLFMCGSYKSRDGLYYDQWQHIKMRDHKTAGFRSKHDENLYLQLSKLAEELEERKRENEIQIAKKRGIKQNPMVTSRQHDGKYPLCLFDRRRNRIPRK